MRTWSSTRRGRRWCTSAAGRRFLVAACCAVGLACGGERSLRGISGPSGGGTGTTTRDAALVGSWWRIVLFTDEDGTTHASETTWRFEAAGSATRTVVASNLTYGFFDTVVAGARWRTEGGTVVITYVSPASGTVRFAYRISGDTLLMDARAFLRVP